MMMITIMILIGNFKLCEKSFMRKMGKVRLFSHFFLSLLEDFHVNDDNDDDNDGNV